MKKNLTVSIKVKAHCIVYSPKSMKNSLNYRITSLSLMTILWKVKITKCSNLQECHQKWESIQKSMNQFKNRKMNRALKQVMTQAEKEKLSLIRKEKKCFKSSTNNMMEVMRPYKNINSKNNRFQHFLAWLLDLLSPKIRAN